MVRYVLADVSQGWQEGIQALDSYYCHSLDLNNSLCYVFFPKPNTFLIPLSHFLRKLVVRSLRLVISGFFGAIVDLILRIVSGRAVFIHFQLESCFAVILFERSHTIHALARIRRYVFPPFSPTIHTS